MNSSMKPPVLALDVGEARIGVALSDALHLTAQPRGYIPGKPVEAALRAVEDLARERGVETIVVGYPLSLRGRKTLSTEKAEAFAEALRGRLPEVRVELWDERLSTVQALATLREGAVRGKKRKQKVDQIAAALILQNYLDCQRRKE